MGNKVPGLADLYKYSRRSKVDIIHLRVDDCGGAAACSAELQKSLNNFLVSNKRIVGQVGQA